MDSYMDGFVLMGKMEVGLTGRAQSPRLLMWETGRHFHICESYIACNKKASE